MRFWRVGIFLFLTTVFLQMAKGAALEEGFCIDTPQNNLFQDLMIVGYWDKRLSDRFPVTYDHLLEGGYLNMPSARMGCEGEVGIGYSHVPPYRNYNLRCQFLDRLEFTGNYRIFTGIDDPILTKHGFGDLSDKGVNFKFSLFSPEDSQYRLPGVSFGFQDFIGTRNFKARYIVLTKVFLKYHFEISLGYGAQRIRGWFGGLSWMPFRCSQFRYLQDLSFVAEYDATPYKDPDIEKHPKGRKKKSSFNVGLKYRLWNSIDFSASYVRGDAFAFSLSAFYNFGYTRGVLPKIDDPLPYRSPINHEELGLLRPDSAFVQEIVLAMKRQGFNVWEIWLECDDVGSRSLRFKISNQIYREEKCVRSRLNALLAGLIPDDIEYVDVVIQTEGFDIQEYRYEMSFVREYQLQQIGRHELNILTPLCEVTPIDPYNSRLLFKQEQERWNLEILPKNHTVFGSSKGKVKCAIGLSLNVNGFLPFDIYYSTSFGYFIFSNLKELDDFDRLNPSQIINVRSDNINYFKQRSVTLDEAYIQKVFSLGKGWYTRLSGGYFEYEYGGVAGEVLYYPVHTPWAVGAEGAVVKKRTYEGIGFTDRIRKLHGFHRTYKKYPFLSHYFLNVYYDWRLISTSFKVSAGKFLANDYGARFEITRYFPSGLQITVWATYTNGHDEINGHTYYDKGIYFSMPLDIFYTRSSRSRWGYGMSAWLRDVGVRAFTGPEIYYLINEQRQINR